LFAVEHLEAALGVRDPWYGQRLDQPVSEFTEQHPDQVLPDLDAGPLPGPGPIAASKPRSSSAASSGISSMGGEVGVAVEHPPALRSRDAASHGVSLAPVLLRPQHPHPRIGLGEPLDQLRRTVSRAVVRDDQPPSTRLSD